MISEASEFMAAGHTRLVVLTRNIGSMFIILIYGIILRQDAGGGRAAHGGKSPSALCMIG